MLAALHILTVHHGEVTLYHEGLWIGLAILFITAVWR
jgi:hypothetical protein